MLGGIHTDLVVTVAVLFLTQTGTLCRAENGFLLVGLPEWRAHSEYTTQCFDDRRTNLNCDWTTSEKRAGDAAVHVLESGPLGIEGQACLEFWYLVPVAANGSELRVLLKSSIGSVEIWTSPALPQSAWRQVFVLLNITERGTQVVFEAVQGLSIEKQITFKQIGVRRGSCGQQCESNTELWTDETTRCLCSAGQLSCFPSQCPEGQLCGPQRGGPDGTSTFGMCTIHSHTDGSTFDGVLFRFMATCTYVLAKTCSPTEALPMFSVEAVSEENDNASLLNVQKINIDIGINRVSLLKSQTGRVVVNGVWRKLPLTLSSGTVNIKSNPATIVLDSTFGLTVSFDKAGAVHVTLPSTYSNKVCGMCGNFNHLKEDDFHNPNAQNVTALAESWQTGKTASSCEAILLPHQCDPLEKAEYASELYCGGLFSTTGPFADCLSVVQAESYFRGCVFGMCSTHGDPAVLCETLQIYSDVCSKAGIAVSMLRNSTFCPLQCGENSHYNSCADGCPKVCSTLDIAGSCGSCEARCECDSGFKLSGEKCVPEEDCGCWYNGKHYEKGETLVEGHCVQQCQCMGNNNMQCTKMQCGNNEVCKVKDGVKACFSFKSATCSVYGDPHYITYDRLAYDFQGGCSYILTTTCSGESSVQFTVFGHNMHPPLQNFTQSKLEAVALQVEDLHIILNQSGKVYVKYNHVQLPYSTSGTYGSVWVYVKNNYIILETTFGLRMQIDGKNRLFLQVDEHYKYELCGLCGTYSGYQDDDFVTPEGENLSEAFEFGDSWRVPNNSECIAHPNDPRLCDMDEMDKASNECSALFGDAFMPCHEHIHPSIYLNSCVYDYCATSGDQHTLCESLQSYATACQVAGTELPNWQTGTVCACNIDCNFDNNLCGWKQMITDAFDWTWQRGSTPTLMTGPSADHTGDGHYMYIEASSVKYGDPARLISSVCSDPGPQCLQFWYHMYGSADTMGLHIYLLRNGTANQIWRKRNDQGNVWHLAQVDIEATTAFQIIIEGRRGSNDQSDVAIDDVKLIHGPCSAPPSVPVQTTAAPQPPIVNASFQPPITNIAVAPTMEETTNLINKDNLTEAPDNRPPLHPACQLLCNFEQDLCQWNQMPTDAFDWTRQSGSTPTMNTGPSSDHTTGDGHYLYIEANSASYGDTARFISSVCSDPGPQCLQFWYHMYGSADTMGLHIYLLQNRTANQIWKKRNDQGNMWHLAQVDIEAIEEFQIIFEGRRGSNDQSDVAIDDVMLHRGQCAALSCPQNSHYATCVPACSPTCLYLNGPSRCSNNEACVPGCVCDDGFVLKSQVCVPLQQCGCVDRNGTKHQFNEKWYTDHCSEQCECEEDDGIGKIDCDDKDKCDGNAVCLQNENGNYYCQSTGFDECTIKGEYRTFDKMKHDFEGEHSYVLVRTSNLPNNLPDIYIEGINTPALGDRDGQHESESSIEEDQSSRVGEDDEENEDDDNSKKQSKHHRLQELKIRVYNHTVEFKKNRNLIVDGKRTDTPISVTGGLKIWERSSRIYLQTDFGLSVEFDRHSTAEIVLPRIYRRKVGGLCGNFDGQKKNDKMKPDGTMARSTREFGESWRV